MVDLYDLHYLELQLCGNNILTFTCIINLKVLFYAVSKIYREIWKFESENVMESCVETPGNKWVST